MKYDYTLEEAIHDALESHKNMFMNDETYYVVKTSEKKGGFINHIDVKVYSRYSRFMSNIGAGIGMKNKEIRGYVVKRTSYRMLYFKDFNKTTYSKDLYYVYRYRRDLKTARSVILFAKELYEVDSKLTFDI